MKHGKLQSASLRKLYGHWPHSRVHIIISLRCQQSMLAPLLEFRNDINREDDSIESSSEDRAS